jgi:signal transduction histidine kinase
VLKKLRHKIILVIMLLVGVMLAGVLGGSVISARQAQEGILGESLDKSLEGNIYRVPNIVDAGGGVRDGGSHASLLVLSVDIDDEGGILTSNNSMVTIDADVLNDIVTTVLSSQEDSGTIPDYHVTWKRRLKTSGAWRLAIADTSGLDTAFEKLVIQNSVIFTIAMVTLFVLAWFLSAWLIRPVQQAWTQQRRFVADASHELKTPLAVILANTQILARDESIPQDSRRWVQSTDDEARHMKALVEELLELARTDESQTEEGANVLHREDVDFSELVEDAALEFDAIAFEKGSEIKAEIAPGIHVQGDREWLARLAKIFIDNACKYTQVGQAVTVRLWRDGKTCKLSVNNRGNVIAPEDLEHIFDRFYRTDKARSRQGGTGGFGLGLAIAQGIAKSHKGDIAATSTEAEGTTFTATLPLA